MIRSNWGARLKQVFNDIPDPSWVASDTAGLAVGQSQPPRVSSPDDAAPRAPAQTLAQQS
jgi:putative proteasome-type protease